MAGLLVHVMMKLLLLLLSFISTGVNGDDGLILAEQVFDISVPCGEDSFCFHLWQLNSSQMMRDYIAIVSNGVIQTSTSEDEDSKCTLQIKDLTQESVGRHYCRRRPVAFSPHNTSTEFKLMPGKTMTLQCIVLSYIKTGHCYTQLHQVTLTWVDEAGTDIQQDSQYLIKKDSPCDITLTVTLQSPDSKKFRCQATVGKQVQTSVEMRVKVPALKGRGRGLIIEMEPENKGGNQDTIGAAVGVVGCLVLTALAALFIVNKRRTRSQLPDESCYTASTNNVIDEDDVIYCEVIHPVSPDREWVHDDESTEYACVRYK